MVSFREKLKKTEQVIESLTPELIMQLFSYVIAIRSNVFVKLFVQL
jgi:hypothetical protein